MKLAEEYGIRDYPCPAGGCLLTDPGFGKRMKDLISHHPGFDLGDIHLLKIGRHFRLSPWLKLVVGRNEEDNRKIKTFSRPGDLLLKASQFPGPLSLLRGQAQESEIEKAAAITVRYGKGKEAKRVMVILSSVGEETERTVLVSSLPESEIRQLMIGE